MIPFHSPLIENEIPSLPAQLDNECNMMDLLAPETAPLSPFSIDPFAPRKSTSGGLPSPEFHQFQQLFQSHNHSLNNDDNIPLTCFDLLKQKPQHHQPNPHQQDNTIRFDVDVSSSFFASGGVGSSDEFVALDQPSNDVEASLRLEEMDLEGVILLVSQQCQAWSAQGDKLWSQHDGPQYQIPDQPHRVLETRGRALSQDSFMNFLDWVCSEFNMSGDALLRAVVYLERCQEYRHFYLWSGNISRALTCALVLAESKRNSRDLVHEACLRFQPEHLISDLPRFIHLLDGLVRDVEARKSFQAQFVQFCALIQHRFEISAEQLSRCLSSMYRLSLQPSFESQEQDAIQQLQQDEEADDELMMPCSTADELSFSASSSIEDPALLVARHLLQAFNSNNNHNHHSNNSMEMEMKKSHQQPFFQPSVSLHRPQAAPMPLSHYYAIYSMEELRRMPDPRSLIHRSTQKPLPIPSASRIASFDEITRQNAQLRHAHNVLIAREQGLDYPSSIQEAASFFPFEPSS